MTEPTLFGDEEAGSTPPEGPLAARMRPVSLEQFVGQEQLLAPGTALRRAIEQDAVSSAIFWGPPGCGKSTLAAVIAARTQSHFQSFSAVVSGVADVRAAITSARNRLRSSGKKTILFVDEIHRFNRSQQDAFLPHVEDGTIVLIVATTENPYFSVNSPLLSRARIFRFEALEPDQIRSILRAALEDERNGLGGRRVELEPDAEEHLVTYANGDARRVLNALELAMVAAEPDEEGQVRITLAQAEDAIQRRALAYDKVGDQHYDVVSAFIKSMRGSDPDAAVYWMQRMLAAGEDPRFICRRMMVHAAEDVGLADPQALLIASAAAHALELIGLPEAAIPMTEAVLYIATAPKSNAVVSAIGRVQADIENKPAEPVPAHLRDTSYRGARALGHGRGYLYPHDHPDHHVPQQYLPDGLDGSAYYTPSTQGFEQSIRERLARWRPERQETDE